MEQTKPVVLPVQELTQLRNHVNKILRELDCSIRYEWDRDNEEAAFEEQESYDNWKKIHDFLWTHAKHTPEPLEESK